MSWCAVLTKEDTPTERAGKLWFVSGAIWKPAIGFTHGDIHHKVERYFRIRRKKPQSAKHIPKIVSFFITLVERPCVTIQTPMVRHGDLSSTVKNCRRQHSSFEELPVELYVEHKVETHVGVCTAITEDKNVSGRIAKHWMYDWLHSHELVRPFESVSMEILL